MMSGKKNNSEEERIEDKVVNIFKNLGIEVERITDLETIEELDEKRKRG